QVFPRRSHRDKENRSQRDAGNGPDQHKPRRTAEPHGSDAESPDDAANQCVQQEMGEPPLYDGPELRELQLRSEASDARNDPGGCGRFGIGTLDAPATRRKGVNALMPHYRKSV